MKKLFDWLVRNFRFDTSNSRPAEPAASTQPASKKPSSESDNLNNATEGKTMTFRFSKASLDRLATVDPALQKVAHRALELSPIDFVVVQGNRTLDEQKRLYGKGRTAAQCRAKGVPIEYARPGEAKVTWTLNSNHIGGKAVDVAPYVDGGIQWDDSGKRGLWPKIAAAFKQAAKELGVPITWGGDWTTTVDRPHFELKR